MKKNDSKVLKKWMEERGCSVIDLANKLNITEQAIYYQLKRKDGITASFIKKLKNVGIQIFDMDIPNENIWKEKYMSALEQIAELQKDNRELMKKIHAQRVGK